MWSLSVNRGLCIFKKKTQGLEISLLPFNKNYNSPPPAIIFMVELCVIFTLAVLQAVVATWLQ